MTTHDPIPMLAAPASEPFAAPGERLAIGAPAYGSAGGVWSVPTTDRTRLAAQLT